MSAVDDYIARCDEPARGRLQQLAALIRAAAPDAVERIAYGMPTWWLNGNLVHIAGFPGHVGFYPTPDGVAHVADRLQGFTWAKGSIQFAHEQPLPVAMVRDVLQYRLAQQRAKPAKAAPKE